MVIETDAAMPAYLVLSDTFDPGWSATVDGQPAPIWPAYLAFRAVYLPQGKHTVVFTYRPAGFVLGLGLSGFGMLLGLFFWFWPLRPVELAPDHAELSWPPRWRTWWFVGLGAIVLISVVWDRTGRTSRRFKIAGRIVFIHSHGGQASRRCQAHRHRGYDRLGK